jgi:hypothetical protein
MPVEVGIWDYGHKVVCGIKKTLRTSMESQATAKASNNMYPEIVESRLFTDYGSLNPNFATGDEAELFGLVGLSVTLLLNLG